MAKIELSGSLTSYGIILTASAVDTTPKWMCIGDPAAGNTNEIPVPAPLDGIVSGGFISIGNVDPAHQYKVTLYINGVSQGSKTTDAGVAVTTINNIQIPVVPGDAFSMEVEKIAGVPNANVQVSIGLIGN